MATLRRIPLLGWILIAIVLGVALGPVMPKWLGDVFLTYNSIFSGFLGFAVPLLIFGLITPAIAELGQGAGKWLGVTAGIAYSSTILAGLLTYVISVLLYPKIISATGLVDLAEVEGDGLEPYFTLSSTPTGTATNIVLAPPIEVMTALVLAFLIGLGLTMFRRSVILEAAKEFRVIIEMAIKKIIVPALPLYIFGTFMDLSYSGEAWNVITTFLVVVVTSFVLTFVVLLIQFTIAGVASGQNPLKLLWGMKDAYFTALGTSSSAATIPITLGSAKKIGVSDTVASFVVPLGATIHLSGSMVKITTFSIAVLILMGGNYSFAALFPFILMLGVMMIAAPGVPGGAIAAASGLLVQLLGFGDAAIGLMFAAYIALDSFGTATNVTGDGAIAMLVDKLSKGQVGDGEREPLEGITELAVESDTIITPTESTSQS